MTEMLSTEARHLLLPLPLAVSASSAGTAHSEPSSSTSSSIRKLEQRLKQANEQIAGQKRRLEAAGGNDKGRGKGNKSRRIRRMPFIDDFEAKGFVTKTKDGEPICFGFNLASGCPDASPGQRCKKGWHVCAAKGCQDKRYPHSATTH